MKALKICKKLAARYHQSDDTECDLLTGLKVELKFDQFSTTRSTVELTDL